RGAVGHEPRLHGGELAEERVGVDDEVAQDRGVRERLHDEAGRAVAAHERLAPQHGAAVDHDAAAPADGHPARPPERQRGVGVVLDPLQRVEHRGAVVVGHLEHVAAPGGVPGGRARDLQPHGPRRRVRRVAHASPPLPAENGVAVVLALLPAPTPCSAAEPTGTCVTSTAPPGPSRTSEWRGTSSVAGKSRRWCAPRDSSRASAAATVACATSSVAPSSRVVAQSVLSTALVSVTRTSAYRARRSSTAASARRSPSASRQIPTSA